MVLRGSLAFDAVERVADTLIGVAIAWGFSYVLPTWERTQIPSMIERTLAAQARHAHLALGLLQLQLPDAFDDDLSPWLLRRLDLVAEIAVQVRRAADQTLKRLPKNIGSK